MALPITANIERVRGDTKPFIFQIRNESNELVDLTGYSFILTVDSRRAPDDETTRIFNVSGVSNQTGIIRLIPTVDDVNLVGSYFYDAQFTDPAGLICTISRGRIRFTQDITK